MCLIFLIIAVAIDFCFQLIMSFSNHVKFPSHLHGNKYYLLNSDSLTKTYSYTQLMCACVTCDISLLSYFLILCTLCKVNIT